MMARTSQALKGMPDQNRMRAVSGCLLPYNNPDTESFTHACSYTLARCIGCVSPLNISDTITHDNTTTAVVVHSRAVLYWWQSGMDAVVKNAAVLSTSLLIWPQRLALASEPSRPLQDASYSLPHCFLSLVCIDCSTLGFTVVSGNAHAHGLDT
jgi:hypothetical protein